MVYNIQNAERKETVSQRILHPAKLSFKNVGEINTLPNFTSQGSSLPLNCPSRNAKGNPSDWHEKTLDSN